MEQTKTFSRGTWFIVLAIGVVGLVFLLRDHSSHVFSVLPYLILLACPLIHLFMHKGHGGHDHGAEDKSNKTHAH
jgi:hypothetical protein